MNFLIVYLSTLVSSFIGIYLFKPFGIFGILFGAVISMALFRMWEKIFKNNDHPYLFIPVVTICVLVVSWINLGPGILTVILLSPIIYTMWSKNVMGIIVSIFIFFLFLNNYYISTVNGSSMAPTINNGEAIFMEKVTDIKRGDVIIFQTPDPDILFMKRVIGIPGDSIQSCWIGVLVNGKMVNEPGNIWKPQEMTLKKGEYFVVGDSKHSKDSRVFGAIKKNKILYRAIFKLTPFPERIKKVKE